MQFTWTNDLMTGNPIIDMEHKQLIQAVNTLQDACKSGKGRDELAKSVNFLVSYTKTHFSHEQDLQKKHNYPRYDSHLQFHITFVNKISAVAEKLKVSGPTIAVLSEFNMIVASLIAHIKTEDVRVAKHIQASDKK